MLEEALQIAEKRREATGKGEKQRHTHLNVKFQRTARRDKKAFLSDVNKFCNMPIMASIIKKQKCQISAAG